MDNVKILDWCFNFVKERAKEGIQHLDWNGIEEWNKCKRICKIFNKLDFVMMNWILPKETQEIILSKLAPVKNMIDKCDESESHHFLRQHVRITLKAPTIEHILQLGFNIGQWLGKPDNNAMSILEYEHYRLSSLSTYISQEELDMHLCNVPSWFIPTVEYIMEFNDEN